MEKPIRATPLEIRRIPNVDPQFAEKLNLPSHIRSLGLLISTIDDVGYTAIDEATKKAAVEVVYAKLFLCRLRPCVWTVVRRARRDDRGRRAEHAFTL
ncbi:hypothetical protein P4V43_22615 [Brevibacillus fortis]|nr:hypothetical protein [Brevibacillus fortis]MED1784627.1 hypothetical protein [Brevibacillus fortis]